MFFNGWMPLLRVLLVGSLAYVSLIVILRISGKRALAQLNAFDFIVTVALGSTLATVVLSKDVALAEGALAFALLVSLQYVVAWLSVRSATFSRLIKSEPRLLLHKGRFLEQALMKERIKKEELEQVMRRQGVADIEVVEAVVLETNGRFSIISGADNPSSPTLSDLEPKLKQA